MSARSFPRRNFCSFALEGSCNPKSSTFNWNSFCSEDLLNLLVEIFFERLKKNGHFTGQAASNLGQPTKRKTQGLCSWGEFQPPRVWLPVLCVFCWGDVRMFFSRKITWVVKWNAVLGLIKQCLDIWYIWGISLISLLYCWWLKSLHQLRLVVYPIVL